MLMIYMDDFKMSGPKGNLKKGWELVCSAVQMGKMEPMGQFLGCNHERFNVTLPNKVQITGTIYNMENYLKTLVAKYKKMVKDTTGKEPNMIPVPTPFLPEDQKDAPARKAMSEFPAAVCPFCDASFPVWELGHDRTGLCAGRCMPEDLRH